MVIKKYFDFINENNDNINYQYVFKKILSNLDTKLYYIPTYITVSIELSKILHNILIKQNINITYNDSSLIFIYLISKLCGESNDKLDILNDLLKENNISNDIFNLVSLNINNILFLYKKIAELIEIKIYKTNDILINTSTVIPYSYVLNDIINKDKLDVSIFSLSILDFENILKSPQLILIISNIIKRFNMITTSSNKLYNKDFNKPYIINNELKQKF